MPAPISMPPLVYLCQHPAVLLHPSRTTRKLEIVQGIKYLSESSVSGLKSFPFPTYRIPLLQACMHGSFKLPCVHPHCHRRFRHPIPLRFQPGLPSWSLCKLVHCLDKWYKPSRWNILHCRSFYHMPCPRESKSYLRCWLWTQSAVVQTM